MARVCQVTGKGPMVGNNVSHANNKTKRRFLPNLQNRRIFVESENRWVSLRVSNAGLRVIDKIGIDAVLADMRARGEKFYADINRKLSWLNLTATKSSWNRPQARVTSTPPRKTSAPCRKK